MTLSVRLIDAPMTTYWLFTNTPTVKRDEVDVEDEGKNGERKKKKRARVVPIVSRFISVPQGNKATVWICSK